MQMVNNNLPTEGIEIRGMGHIMPGQVIDVPTDLVHSMTTKGFTQIKTIKDKGGLKDGMG